MSLPATLQPAIATTIAFSPSTKLSQSSVIIETPLALSSPMNPQQAQKRPGQGSAAARRIHGQQTGLAP
ncbi:hypothetical protein BKA66DRAFT_577279 [Pyrenochaeta sp. MPI-SDFR-AT-0127]|nr:hypothetical protein BKA66DRAFT_577279 [Pyrenochaeta sp. MPI-SDFR-AT-0127]